MTSDQITIALGGDLFLVQEDIAIAVRLIDAQFPPYEQVIPEEHKKIITVDPLHFVDALRRAQLMSSASGRRTTTTSSRPTLPPGSRPGSGARRRRYAVPAARRTTQPRCGPPVGFLHTKFKRCLFFGLFDRRMIGIRKLFVT